MKKLLILALSVMLAGLIVPAASAAGTQTTEATVLKVSGTVQAQLPGQSGEVAVTSGMKLPQGTVITTGSDSSVEVKTIAGSLSNIRANSSVTLDQLSVTTDDKGTITAQTAQLDLHSGNILSTLDPHNHAINHYSVRTPRGVAAARGTAYTVTVTETGTTVATLSGTVTLTPIGGGTPIVIDMGTGVVLSGPGISSPQSLASLVAAEKTNGTANDPDSLTNAMTAMVQTVADAVSSGTVTGPGATTLLVAVVKTASQGNPSQAGAYTSTAIDAANTANANGGTVDTGAINEAGGAGSGTPPPPVNTPITPVDQTLQPVSPSGGNQ